mmetsp:Transcript_32180/g.90564  ORF Transcript_32180/g.90564 Transcript_32180/m.90564 type:complete len:216 (+) Transcript_32180:704-1351(+)
MAISSASSWEMLPLRCSLIVLNLRTSACIRGSLWSRKSLRPASIFLWCASLVCNASGGRSLDWCFPKLVANFELDVSALTSSSCFASSSFCMASILLSNLLCSSSSLACSFFIRATRPCKPRMSCCILDISIAGVLPGGVTGLPQAVTWPPKGVGCFAPGMADITGQSRLMAKAPEQQASTVRDGKKAAVMPQNLQESPGSASISSSGKRSRSCE